MKKGRRRKSKRGGGGGGWERSRMERESATIRKIHTHTQMKVEAVTDTFLVQKQSNSKETYL